MGIKIRGVDQVRLLFEGRLGDAQQEYRFHPDRYWRFDLAWPDLMFAAEYEGWTLGGGRHTRPAGYSNDCEKYSYAALLGWQVVRITAEMLKDGRAAEVAELAAVVLLEDRKDAEHERV